VSNVHLQRLVVRMLYDSRFSESVYSDPAAALAEIELTEEERRWLTTPDRRAYRTDAARRARSLTVVIEEFASTCAYWIAAGRDARALDGYFSSREFHDEIQARGSLVSGFGAYLLSLNDQLEDDAKKRVALSELAGLELALVKLRRRFPLDPKGPTAHGEIGRLALHPQVELFDCAGGTLTLSVEIRQRLGIPKENPVEVMFRPGFRLDGPPHGRLPKIDAGAREFLLLEFRGGETTVGEISEELFHLLTAARSPRTRDELEAEAIQLGAEPDEANEILQGLIDESMLRPR